MATDIVFPPSEVLLRSPSSASPTQASNTENDNGEAARPLKEKKTPPAKPRPVQKPKAVPNAQNAVEKPKMSKSRTGCVTCKLKRLKCDETKPTCQQCQRRKVECGGYKRDFKWRAFDETNAKVAVPNNRKKKHTASFSQSSTASQEHVSADPNASVTVAAAGKTTDPKIARTSSIVHERPLDWNFNASPENDVRRATGSSGAASPSKSVRSEVLDAVLLQTPRTTSTNEDIESTQSDAAGLVVVDPSLLANSSNSPPRMTAPEIETLLASCDPVLGTSSLPNPNQEFDVDQMPQADLLDAPSPPQAEIDSLALIPGDLSWAKGEYYKSMPMDVDFSDDGVEMIAMRFDQLTCGILSVKDGPSENPWRSLVWPMTQSSPSVLHAVCAMTAFHAARREPHLKVKGHEHMQLCFQNLTEGLREDTVTLENAIATSISLAFAQSLSEVTSSGNVYIKGARSIINKALSEHRQRPRQGLELAQLKFLCNAWVYMDVIARLTCTDEDETEEYEEIFSAFSTAGSDHDGFGIDFGLPIDSSLDPLMGCANTLFPLIGRVANLARRVRRSSTTSLAIVDQARELKELIEAWRPPRYIQPPEDTSCTVEHSVQTAEAYRYATLLYLHQTVPDIPSPTSSQLAARVLIFLATVPTTSRFVNVHIFPLMAASCEAVSNEDREWVRKRWAAMDRRLNIGSIGKCMEITEEVWRRRDEISPIGRQPLVSNNRRPNYDLNPGSSSSISSTWISEGNFGASIPMNPDPTWPQVLEWNNNDDINNQYYLGGRLHWLGVMKGWGWDVYL
ncbi:hypothetical protein K461DRAFT_251761 [Myriangium duriaei CBS 260.36]|uniref:Zn(2)-C6 fungal-type domain-containing protein n=1 Tax=Myriangium duriaei CBS 260.36 TaxID=1168546 RepID=A0A9P4J5B8_9PEZI|nr:hypothetical protein K461DRAFT_251761 [Myriangium duriaei CBS 260.36]